MNKPKFLQGSFQRKQIVTIIIAVILLGMLVVGSIYSFKQATGSTQNVTTTVGAYFATTETTYVTTIVAGGSTTTQTVVTELDVNQIVPLATISTSTVTNTGPTSTETDTITTTIQTTVTASTTATCPYPPFC